MHELLYNTDCSSVFISNMTYLATSIVDYAFYIYLNTRRNILGETKHRLFEFQDISVY